MVKSMQELMNEAYEAKIQTETFRLNQVEAEFKTLASQINPHFLYNTLETIRTKAYVNNDKETADLVKKLGKFMLRCLEVKTVWSLSNRSLNSQRAISNCRRLVSATEFRTR